MKKLYVKPDLDIESLFGDVLAFSEQDNQFEDPFN